MLESKGQGTWRCFPEVSESHHSSLVLVGAPVQGCSSPMIHAWIKCSLRADSLTLRHGESSKTAHKMSWVIHKLCRMITKLSITTKPSRWWRSPRVTSKNSHLTVTSLRDRWMHTCYSLSLMGSLILDSQIIISSLGSCTPLQMKGVSQLNKWARDLKWTSRGCIYTPSRRSMWPDASGRWQRSTSDSNMLSDRTHSRVRSGVTGCVRSLKTFSRTSLFHLHGRPDTLQPCPISSPSRPVANPSRVDRRQRHLHVRSSTYHRLVTWAYAAAIQYTD
jgi:hypothetical protein